LIRVTAIPTIQAPFSGYHPVQMAKHFGDKVFVIPTQGNYITEGLDCYICLCDRVGKKLRLPIFFIRLLALLELFVFLMIYRSSSVFVHSFIFCFPAFLTLTRYILIFHGSDFRLIRFRLFSFLASKAKSCFGVGFSVQQGSLKVDEIPNLFYPVIGRKNNQTLNATKVLFVLRDAAVKNPSYPFKFFESLEINRFPVIAIRIAGLYRSTQQNEISAENSSQTTSNVVCLGRLGISELHKEYSSADILIVPSFSEGVCKAMLEGFSVGLPVLIDHGLKIPAEFEEHVTRVRLNDYKAVADKCDELVKLGKLQSSIDFANDYLKQSLDRLVTIYSLYYEKKIK
jgi:glycosyltransferase involved in cell wall biosynthesis